MAVMKGRRVYNSESYSFGRMEPGDYGRGPDGDWWLCAPTGQRGRLSEWHSAEEHEDGTITVAPSLAYKTTPGSLGQPDPTLTFDVISGWHGWLRRGMWSEA